MSIATPGGSTQRSPSSAVDVGRVRLVASAEIEFAPASGGYVTSVIAVE